MKEHRRGNQKWTDYVRGCITSTTYWLPSTSWRVCQRLYHFYHILTAFNKLKSMSEVVPLLPHTDCLQQVEEYVRGCTTSTTYWPPSTSWRVCQRLYHFYQILTAFNKFKIFSLIDYIKYLDNIDISTSIKCNPIPFLYMDFVQYQCFLFSFRQDNIHSLYVDDNCQICLPPLKQLTSSHEC